MYIFKYSIIFIIVSQLLFATTLPTAKTHSFTVTPSFDTFCRGNGSVSQNNAKRIIIKNDNSHYTRQGFIGFNLKKYTIPGMIKSVTLRLYVDRIGQYSVENYIRLVKDDAFWNTSFKFNKKPKVGSVIKTYTVTQNNQKHWVDITLPKVAVDRIYKNGKLSLSLIGKTRGQKAWTTFGSSEDSAHKPQLLINLNTTNITSESSNDIRYITFVAAKEENGFSRTIIGDLDIIDQNAHIIDNKNWTEIKSSGGVFKNLLDSNPKTLWVGKGKAPHFVTFDMKQSHDIGAIIYTPRARGYYGRVADFMVYGSNDKKNWSLIASRQIPHGNGNNPKVAYAGKFHTNNLQREDAFTFAIRPSQSIERKRLGNSALRSGLNTTGLYASREGLLIVSVTGDVENNHIELRTGHWARSKRYTLKKGLNSINVHPKDYLYIQASKDNQKTNKEKVNVTFISSGVETYPLLKVGKTTLTQWNKALKDRTTETVQLETKKVLLTFEASELDKLDPIDFNLLAKTYDNITTIVERAAGIDPRTKNPLHHPDANKYHYVTLDHGYMCTFKERIGYRGSLTYRMLEPDRAKNFWGIWHEMGHNLQTSGLLWKGQGEVSVNIYAFAARAYTMPFQELITLYDKNFKRAFNKLKKAKTYTTLDRESREMMFHHLFFLFGEKFYYNLHQRYRENLHTKKDPEFFVGTANEQMNVLAIIASKVTQTNLVEFFDFWKFPLTQKTRNTISNYGYGAPTDFKQLPSELVRYKAESEYDMVF